MSNPLRLSFLITLLVTVSVCHAQNPYKSLGVQEDPLTLSKGKYQEFFPNDTLVQIGSVLLNTVTGKVVAFLKTDTLYSEADLKPELTSRWMSPDPLAEKYVHLSPYNFVDNNPVRYIDPDGREIVDPKGKRVDITVNKDGSLTFSKNATQSIMRVANALNMTETGRGQLQQMISSDIKVKINVSEKTVVRERDGKKVYTYGRTIQGNNNEKDNYGKTKNADGTYAIKEATMTVYEGSIKEAAKEGSNSKLEGLSTEQGIGAVAGHESVHATDKAEINKDIQAEVSGGDRTKAREVKPNKVEQKIIDEYKK